jgi:oxygen-independent coproporphyrinogen-3 oxidase
MMSNASSATTVPVELLRKYDRPGPRYTSYPTAPIWSENIQTEAYREALQQASGRVDDPLAVYCHIPFCRMRCFYCGCNTCITNRPENTESYIDRMRTEIHKTAELLGERNRISQLHFGGGTPTFVGVEGLERILDKLDKHFEYIENAEKSIEIDPRVTTFGQLDFLSGRGFNRVSIGVQDFEPAVQEAIGRIQSEQRIIELLEYARKLHFKGINFDLIYGLPKQNVETFTRTLEKTIELRPDRLAVYSFAYLPTVKSHQSIINEKALPSTEEKYRLFATAVEKLTGAGYRQIGMDHFALPEDELSIAQSDGRLHRNFMGYTVQAAPEMIGLGMSSIGYVNDAFFQNYSKLDSYKDAIRDHGFAVYRGMKLSKDDLIRQYTISSLMCNFRLNFNLLEEKFGVTYDDYFKSEHAGLLDFERDQFLRRTEEGLEITPLGRTFVRNIAMTFDTYLAGQGKKATYSRTI